MAGKFNADYAGIGEMLNADFMEAAMRDRAERGKEFAVAVAPVDVDGDHPGLYRDSFEVSSGKHGGFEHDRAYGRLTNAVDYALWVEVGTEHNQAHHVLSRAADIMGA